MGYGELQAFFSTSTVRLPMPETARRRTMTLIAEARGGGNCRFAERRPRSDDHEVARQAVP